MFIISKTPNESGAHSNIQTWNNDTPPSGHAVVPDDFDTSVFYEYKGFVTLTVENDVVTAMVANEKALKAWEEAAKEMPAPEPSVAERVVALEAEAKELNEALTMILEGVTE